MAWDQFSSVYRLMRAKRKPHKTGIDAVLKFFDDRANLRLVRNGGNVLIWMPEIRALQNLRLSDTIHIACAAEAKCSILATVGIR